MRMFFKLLIGLALIFLVTNPAFSQLSENVIRQIESLNREKEARTPVQKKIDCQLLYAMKQERGEAITVLVRMLEVNVNKDADGLVPVDIKVSSVTKALLQTIKNAGGTIFFESSLFKTINATIPLQAVEQIATSAEVLFIYPADSAFTNSPEKGVKNKNFFKAPFKPLTDSDKKEINNLKLRADEIRGQLNDYLQNKEGFDKNFFFTGSVTSEGDVTHRAAEARTAFGVTGSGVKIGVISDGVSNLASSQASGDLDAVTVLNGQAGSGDEGTAMLEIIHDLAPGAQLFFATGLSSQTSFAQNILDLRTAGCDIIVDDVKYSREAVFQDDNVARAVNTVTAAGALYFSSAGNQGNKDDNTSGVWEGDFNDAGTGTVGTVTIAGGTVHNFSGGTTNNQITAYNAGRLIGLFWSDPLGGSGNDYDLYILDAGLTTIVNAATNVQDGNDDPIELSTISPSTGSRIVIFKKTTAAVRALHLNTNGGRLNFNTQGQAHGHSAAAQAYSVAATPAATAFGAYPNSTGPFPNPYSSSNLSEIFTSDGPRRIFYNANGTPVTPGNVLFATNGGTVRQKPDITAADGISVTGAGGFHYPFFGTSAAAPHAAAIAALVKSALPSITPAQIRTALTSSAIDIEAPGIDRNTGAGIVMAYQSLVAAGITSAPVINAPTVTQPTCTTPTGTIVINATGSGTLEYNVDNGTTWQLFNTFSGLTPGNYSIKVRQQTNPANSATYSDNPVVINAGPADTQAPTIVLKSNPAVFLTSANTYTVQLRDVLQSVSDNCDPNPSATVSTLQVSCTNPGPGSSATPHQAYVSNTTAGNANYDGQFGLAFKVNNAGGIVIDKLGAFDDQGNGITGNQSGGVRVAIFNVATQAIVAGLDVTISGTTDPLVGNYRMRSITQVTLAPGTYAIITKGYVGEKFYNRNQTGALNASGDNAGGALTFLNTVYYGSTPDFSFPAGSGDAGNPNEYIAGTFNYALSAGNNVTVTATDVSGNISMATATVNVIDTFYVLTTKNATVNLNASGQATIAAADVLQSLKNNCGADVTSSTFQVSPSSFTCADIAGSSTPHQAYVSNTTAGNANYDGQFGLAFKVNNANGVIIDKLGAFDDQGNGITGNQNGGVRVAIFNVATQATVPGLDVTISSSNDPLVGSYRMRSITPVTLAPGNYVIITKGYVGEKFYNRNQADPLNPAGDNASGALTFLNTVYYSSAAAFGFPTGSADAGNPNEYVAGTFSYASGGSSSTPHQAYVSNTSVGNANYDGQFGLAFKVSSANGIVIDKLGAFDDQGNGITGYQSGGVRVAIFSQSTQVIVPGLDVTISGTTDPLVGNYRMRSITPVTLPAGNYVIITKGYVGEKFYNRNQAGPLNPTGDNAGGALTFLNTVYYSSAATFSFPNNAADAGNPNEYVAGTFNYALNSSNINVSNNKTVTVTATDTHGNVTTATATVTLTNTSGSCTAPASQLYVAQNQTRPVQNTDIVEVSDNPTQGFKVYPNPSSGQFTVQLYNLKASKVSLQIMDANGQVIEQKTTLLSGKTSSLSIPVDISKHALGIYLIKAISADGVRTAKVVVSR